jgi:hypothetical protein
VLQESDFAPYKPKCDVSVVNASRPTRPGGKPMRRWPVGFRFGDAIQKTFASHWAAALRRSLGTLGMLGITEPAGRHPSATCDYERRLAAPI